MPKLIYIAMLLPLVIPTGVFATCALMAGLAPAETVAAIIEQYTAARQNLLVVSLLGLFPILLLLIGLWLHRKFGGNPQVGQWLAWGGLIPILLVLIWINSMFWPIFLPERTYPGFPHGLEFIIGPGIFAPVAMVVGMGLAWLIRRMRQSDVE